MLNITLVPRSRIGTDNAAYRRFEAATANVADELAAAATNATPEQRTESTTALCDLTRKIAHKSTSGA